MSKEKLNGSTVSRVDFDELFDRIKTWGRWPNSARGATNAILPAVTVAACRLVSSGRVVPTALAWNTVAGPDNTRPALHYMTDLGDREAPEPSCYMDFLGVDHHGKSVSHLDALSHIAFRGQLHNSRSARDSVGAGGASYWAVASVGRLVTRGVLLDVAAVRGVDWLEPGQAVHAGDLQSVERQLGVTVGPGDAVLLRNGHLARRAARGAWDPSNLSASLHVDAMPMLAERGISVFGADGDSDVRPSPVPGVHSPIHILAIAGLGIPLLNNLDLGALSQACAQEGKYEFLLVVAPLNVADGTGSPVIPVAVL